MITRSFEQRENPLGRRTPPMAAVGTAPDGRATLPYKDKKKNNDNNNNNSFIITIIIIISIRAGPPPPMEAK